jgi:hypothetical protein
MASRRRAWPAPTGKIWHHNIVFARSGAYANVTTNAQNAPAFSRHRGRIGQMVIDLPHKHEIDAAVREWKLVRCGATKYDMARCRFASDLADHFLGWIEPDDPRIKFDREHLGKPSGAAAKVHDQRDCGAIGMGR